VNPRNPDADGVLEPTDDTAWDVSIFRADDPVEGDAAEQAELLPAGDDGFEDETGEIVIAVAPIDDKHSKKSIPFWLELPLLIGIALVVAVIIKTFFFQAFYIPSGSMKETLQIEDRVLVNKIAYDGDSLVLGDVIVFDDPRAGFEAPSENMLSSAVRNVAESIGLATPQSEFIKRIVGVAGDEVELVENQLFVNGEAIDEPYLAEDAQPPSSCGDADYGPMTVPEDHVMVMGDNRCHSSDGRSFGPIPTDDIVGKAFVIIWPPSRWSGL